MGYHKKEFLDLIDIAKQIDASPSGRRDWAHSILIATAQARCLGLKEITVMEFGVATGNGLLQYVDICKTISDVLEEPIKYNIFGFDRKEGLPEGTKDYRDNLELWTPGTYKMSNYEKLNKQLPENASLIIGDVKETVPEFIKEKSEFLKKSPIAYVSVDLDLYSSTKDALKILSEVEPDMCIPSVQMYFDDADLIVTVSQYTGEGLAINEFNNENELRKIEKKILKYSRYYSCHILDHPVRNGSQKPVIPFELTYTDFWNIPKF